MTLPSGDFDVHPFGNPHYLTDPARAKRAAATIAEAIATVDPPHADAYRKRLAEFVRRVDVALWGEALLTDQKAERLENRLAEGTLLATPWRDLTKRERDIWLWGTGEEHITYTWRAGKAAQKYGGTFDGLIPEFLEKYKKSRTTAQLRQLEQYMSIIRCPDCNGQRLNPQACAVTVTTASEKFGESRSKLLEAFRKMYPGSVYLSRVENACAETDRTASGDSMSEREPAR